MKDTGERDTLIDTITQRMLKELEQSVVPRDAVILVLREMAGEDEK